MRKIFVLLLLAIGFGVWMRPRVLAADPKLELPSRLVWKETALDFKKTPPAESLWVVYAVDYPKWRMEALSPKGSVFVVVFDGATTVSKPSGKETAHLLQAAPKPVLDKIYASVSKSKREPDAPLGGIPYQHYSLTSGGHQMETWVDPKTGFLRRVAGVAATTGQKMQQDYQVLPTPADMTRVFDTRNLAPMFERDLKAQSGFSRQQ